MRLEALKEVREIAYVSPGTPFLFDVDAVAENLPDDMAFGVSIAEEFKQIFVSFNASSNPPLQIINIEDGKKLTVEIPGSITETFNKREKLIWIIYELRGDSVYPLLKGPIRLDGAGYFKGLKT